MENHYPSFQKLSTPRDYFSPPAFFFYKGMHGMDWRGGEEFIANRMCRQFENCDHITVQSTQLATPTAIPSRSGMSTPKAKHHFPKSNF
jgi:hypothetical protein